MKSMSNLKIYQNLRVSFILPLLINSNIKKCRALNIQTHCIYIHTYILHIIEQWTQDVDCSLLQKLFLKLNRSLKELKSLRSLTPNVSENVGNTKGHAFKQLSMSKKDKMSLGAKNGYPSTHGSGRRVSRLMPITLMMVLMAATPSHPSLRATRAGYSIQKKPYNQHYTICDHVNYYYRGSIGL